MCRGPFSENYLPYCTADLGGVLWRTALHHDHTIEMATVYDIRVDGKRLGGHMAATNNGKVHYHGLPNYSWASAIEPRPIFLRPPSYNQN